MAGLTSALNISKNALLNFQTATSVISHNVANVNNPAYSRQKAIETTYPPSPTPIGALGVGSKIEKIIRYFDAFLERNINLKKTDYGLFSASLSGLSILEGLFNETQDSGLSQILKKFWEAWQNLANYPENISARTQVIEYGKLIAESFQAKFQGMKDLETQIGLKLKEIVNNINRLASQIAELNLQIVARESGGKTANDLRDQRDRLVGELSQLTNIQYFETKEGAYSIILGKGFNLVTLDSTKKLELSGLDVYWVSSGGEKVPLTSKEVASGELGGWLKLLEQLSDNYNYEYVSGTNALYLKDRPVGELDKFSELGILSGQIIFKGKDHFGKEISGTFIIDPNNTLRDFLNEIEKAYGYTVKAYLKEGRLFVEDKFRGSGKLEFSILTSPPALNFGVFDDPVYQRRITELNLAGKLKLFGEELIKTVNELHTQGVGLEFFTKELEGAYSANKYIKELPYFLELKRNGSFYIWVKDKNGKISPVRIDLNFHEDSTLDDLATTINQALEKAGFKTSGFDYELKTFIRSGRLVFQAQEGISFAFSNDTSGILLSTGINLFFIGTDPADFQVNSLLIQKPELISSGKLDVSALRTQTPLFGIFRSQNQVSLNQTFQTTAIFLRPYEDKGKAYPYPPLPLYEGTYLDPNGTLSGNLTITFKDANGNNLGTPLVIPQGTKISDLPNLLDGSNGIKATLENGILRLELVKSKAPEGAFWFEVNEGTSGINPLIEWNNQIKAYQIEINPPQNNFGSIIYKLNRLPFLRAYQDEFGHLVLKLEPNQTSVYGFEIGESLGGGSDPNSPNDSFISYLKSQNIFLPSFRWNGSTEYRITSGLEPLLKPSLYVGDRNIQSASNVTYTVKFYDSQGNLIGSNLVNSGNSLNDLISNFNNVSGLKADILGDKFYIWLDPSEDIALSNAIYFTIELTDDGDSLYEGAMGVIRTNSGIAGLKAGELSAYLFDEKGSPIDTDSHNPSTDPFRIEFLTDKSLFQIFQTINAPENIQWALSARLDREGKLIVETTGLYHTQSFILEDTKPQPERDFPNPIINKNYLKYDQNTNTYYYWSDYSISGNPSFLNQNLTLTIYDKDGNSLTTTTQSLTTLQDLINWLNNLDLDNDGTKDFSAGLDNSNRLYIKIKDTTFDSNPNKPKILFFSLESNIPSQNIVSFLFSKLSLKEDTDNGLIHTLNPYILKRGDNRIAQTIADSTTLTRENLNLSTLENYYASMVGEIGTTTKTAKESQSFLEDLLRQLQTIKDSISGVSLDEEMTNLIKYQQAFIATTKVIASVEDMFEALISAKR